MNGMKWKTNYPLNQCTDFNVKYYEEQGSYGLAIQNGERVGLEFVTSRQVSEIPKTQ